MKRFYRLNSPFPATLYEHGLGLDKELVHNNVTPGVYLLTSYQLTNGWL
jgi:hypothetical protein